jgi:rRNA maturation RNase YbeY
MRSRTPPVRSNTVTVLNRQRGFRIDCQKLAAAVCSVLDCLRVRGQEVNVVLVSDRTMARLNWTYRHVRGPTDVVSFPMREGEHGDVSGFLLGDVVLSLETLERQAREPHDDGRPATGTPARELALMTVHGVLHLLGFDHEQGRTLAARMLARERDLFARTASLFPDVTR